MTRTAKNCESNVMSTDELERFGYVNVPGLCANRVPARGLARDGSHPRLSNVLDISVRERVRACACVSSRARACPCASVSSVCASVSVVVRERVLPHVPIGALGVAVIWLGYFAAAP